jgi:hypothetical protein
MKYLLTVLAVVVLAVPSWGGMPGSGSPSGELLASRRVLGSVAFAGNSAKLDQEAMAKLDRLAPLLQDESKEDTLLRIEGFAGPGGSTTERFDLSVARARAVSRYLASRHGVAIRPYLTGFGDQRTDLEVAPAKAGRVDIALYHVPWNLSAVSEELVGESSNH